MRRVEVKTVTRGWWWVAGAMGGLFVAPAYAQIDFGKVLRDSIANGLRAPALSSPAPSSALGPRPTVPAPTSGATSWASG